MTDIVRSVKKLQGCCFLTHWEQRRGKKPQHHSQWIFWQPAQQLSEILKNQPGKDSYSMYSFLALWFTSSKALRWRQRSCTEWTGPADWILPPWRRIKLRKLRNVKNHKLSSVQIHQKRDRRQMDVMADCPKPASFPFPLMEYWACARS